jgi:hypothetical protein
VLIKWQSCDPLHSAGSSADFDVSEERAASIFIVTYVGTKYPTEPHRHPEDGVKTFLQNLESAVHPTGCNNQED